MQQHGLTSIIHESSRGMMFASVRHAARWLPFHVKLNDSVNGLFAFEVIVNIVLVLDFTCTGSPL
jgi:hypothetical protein